ncbi:MAG: hypothetical protein Kow00121_47430 [Elainellaceae cyanobacterium]
MAALTLVTITLSPHTVSGQAQGEQNLPSPQPQPSQAGGRPVLRVGSEGEPVSELQAMLKLLGYYSGAIDGVYRASTAAAVSAFQQAIGLQADGVVGAETWNQLLPPSPPASATASTAPSPSTSPASTATPAPAPSSSPFPSPTATPQSTPSPSPTATPAPAASPTPAPAVESPNSNTPSATDTPIELPILRLGMRGPAVARLQDRLKALGFFNGASDGIFGQETQTAVETAQRNYDLEPDGVVGPATWSVLLQP